MPAPGQRPVGRRRDVPCGRNIRLTMDNVKPFRKPMAFPTLWPTKSWYKVSTAIMHNVPPILGTQKYHWHMKADFPPARNAALMSLILQPSGVVMFNPCDTQANTDRVAAYVDKHRAKLRDIGNDQDKGTVFVLVGRLVKHENREMYVVYYIINGQEVYVDERTMRAKLKLDKHPFEDFLFPLHGVLADAEISNDPPKVNCDYVNTLDRSLVVVGIPVVTVETRGYNETPVLFSTPRHLEFMGFTFNGAEK